MGKDLSQIRCRCLWIGLLVISIWGWPAWGTGVCNPVAENDKSRYAVDESTAHYLQQLGFVGEELDKIQSDLAWLKEKIAHMEDMKRFVPQRLYDSVAYKASKIRSLQELKKRYAARVRASSTRKEPQADGSDLSFSAGIRERIRQAGLSDWVDIMPGNGQVKVENRLPILFSSGSSTVAGGYLPFLKKLAGAVKPYAVRIRVDGFADSDPIQTQCYPSNFELGAARAAAVVRALVSCGLKPSVFKISSEGQYPSAAGRASEWKHLRRHADIRIIMTGA